MKKLLCSFLFVLLGSASLSAQITDYLYYPTDSIVIIDLLQYYPDLLTVDISDSAPSRGVVTLLPDNTLRYVANSMTEVVYGDWFYVNFLDGSYPGIHSINILPQFHYPIPNVPPLDGIQVSYVCKDDPYYYHTSLPLSINDFNDDYYNYTILQEPLHGTATIVNTCFSNYELIYEPDTGFIDNDTIVYRACEIYTAEQYCVDIVRIIHVIDCRAVPLLANSDSYLRCSLSNATFTPLENDYADNLPVTVTIVSQATWGDVVVNPDNSITYHAYNADTAITDQFAYQICDALGNCSYPAGVTLTNVPPVSYPIIPFYKTVITAANESVELDFLSNRPGCEIYNCIDLLNSLLHYGSIAVTSDNKCIYTPFENLVAPQQAMSLQEVIPYKICLQHCLLGNVILSVNLTFPACSNDNTTVPYQTPTFISVLDNDLGADPFGIASIDMPPQHGTAIVDNNHILYQPDSAYIGNDTLQYITCDYYGNCDTATVFIAVVPDSVIGISSILSNTFLSTKLWIYPNPTREVLNIVVAPDQQIQGIRVTDMAGHKLFSPTLPTTAGHRARVSIQHLPKGIYLVEVRTDVGVGVQKVSIR
jgi:hypothetical protein